MAREFVKACPWPCCAACCTVWHTLYYPNAYNCAECLAAYACATACKQVENRSCQKNVVSEYAWAAASTALGRQSAWLAGKQGCKCLPSCADSVAAHARDVACKRSCKQCATGPAKKYRCVWVCLSLSFDMSWSLWERSTAERLSERFQPCLVLR